MKVTEVVVVNPFKLVTFEEIDEKNHLLSYKGKSHMP